MEVDRGGQRWTGLDGGKEVDRDRQRWTGVDGGVEVGGDRQRWTEGRVLQPPHLLCQGSSPTLSMDFFSVE